MKHRIIKDHITTRWSGGDTTELFIYPADSQYKKGDYQFRLSTATVEIEESNFTPLPGVDRTLIVLDGKMDLIHEGYHNSVLTPLKFDCFKGDWNTKSIGKCVDFNLMCKAGTAGEVKGYSINEGALESINLKGKMNFIYLYKGCVDIDTITLSADELLQIDEIGDQLIIRASEASRLVVIQITALN